MREERAPHHILDNSSNDCRHTEGPSYGTTPPRESLPDPVKKEKVAQLLF